MAVISGRNGSLKISTGSTVDGASGTATTALASLRTWSIDTSANIQTVDTASMGNFSTWNEAYTLSRSWSASFAGLWDADDTSNPQGDAIQVGMNAAIILYPDAGSTGITYAGSGVITSVTVNASYDGMVEISFSIQGSGALTRDLD